MKRIEQLQQAFEKRSRDNGETFVALRDGSPQWMKDLMHEAHDDMLPDDTRYAMIDECVDALTEYDDWEDCTHEIADGLVDVYNSDLTKWLASHNLRAYYIDEAQREGLISEDADEFQRIGVGQYCEYLEILHVLVAEFQDDDEESEDDE